MSQSAPLPRIVVALVLGAALCLHVTLEAVDVRVEHDKKFNFKPMKSWGWNAKGRGDVIMVRTASDDPEAMKRRVEPWIVDAVASEMTRRGLVQADANPDLTLTYYLLLSITGSAQTVGQFLPSTTQWGLPPFTPSTQSLEVMNQGSLVLDLSAADAVVWRGLAQTKIGFDATDKKRQELLREGVRDLLKRYPPK